MAKRTEHFEDRTTNRCAGGVRTHFGTEVNVRPSQASLPMLASAGRLSGWAGLYEVTPDAHPICGRTPMDGFWLVADFSGHGFMHGPIAGRLMAEFLIEGAATSVDVSSLGLARFAEGRTIKEQNVI